MVYCKSTDCDWNKWDQQNLKHKCTKALIHLDKDGYCYLSQYAREVASQHSAEVDGRILSEFCQDCKKWFGHPDNCIGCDYSVNGVILVNP